MPIRLIDFHGAEVYEAGACLLTLLAYPDASEETLGEVHASLCAYALNVKYALEPDLAIRPQAIEGDGDQGGMPALALVTRDMLHRGAARFADELGKAGLMHSMPARRIKTGCADMVQALDQTEHRDGLRRFRHLAQPSEPALVGFPRRCVSTSSRRRWSAESPSVSRRWTSSRGQNQHPPGGQIPIPRH